MKRFTTLLALVLMLGFGAVAFAQSDEENSGAEEAKKDEVFSSDAAKAAYCLGTQFGGYVKNLLEDVDIDMLNKGVRDGVEGNDSLAGDDEARNEFLNEFFTARRKAESEKRAEEGRAFLEENKTKEGVQVTESGLQYKIVKPGSGRSPKATDEVKVHYMGTFLDGEEFDSSYKRGEPAEFNANQLIPGWTEGLQLMREGAKYEFWVPYFLAYGEQGNPQAGMPGFSTLVFEVELIEVMTPEGGAPADGQILE